MMNMRIPDALILLAVAAILAGCTSTTGPLPPTTILTPEPVTPLKTTVPVTPLPDNEVARISVDHFGMDPAAENVYEFVGKLQVDNGPYRSVQIVLRYPDTQEYPFDFGGMGGANQTRKPFSLFPSDRYKGTNPQKIIVLDGVQYDTQYRYDNGVVSWIATRNSRI